MNNKKSTKRALLSSVLSLLLCCSMLIGTTFAWFTDEVQSANNIITAGNLDVEVVNEGKSIADKDVVLFDNILWEPGVVAYENITVQNLGTLALQYSMNINFLDENFVVLQDGTVTEYGLSSALKVAIVEEEITATDRDELVATIKEWTSLRELVETGKLYPDAPADTKTYGIVIYWQPGENDNNWNVNNGKTTTDGKPLHITLGINLYATQLMHENDSYGPDYDGEAFAPVANVIPGTPTNVPATWGMGGAVIDGGLDLDCFFTFKTTESYEEAQQSAYRYWHADFVVSANRDVEAGSIALAGYYEAYCEGYNNSNWVALMDDQNDITAGTQLRLLELMLNGGSMSYQELCNWVPTFLCGAVDLTGTNAGTTLTVELRLYEVEKNAASTEAETGEYVTIGTYTYTFPAYKVTNSEELKAAIEAGVTDIELADGTYQMPAAAKGKTLTISGSQNAVIEHVNQGENGMNYSLEGSTVVFNGVTIKTTSGTYRGFARSNEITYNGCYFVGSYTLGAGTHTFNDCHFNLQNNYVWTWGGTNVVFDGCTFEDENGVGKAILVHNTVDTEVTIKDCTFIATTGANTWDGIPVAAVSIDPAAAGAKVNVAFVGTNTYSEAFNGLYQLKYATEAGQITATVDGEAVTVPAMKDTHP